MFEAKDMPLRHDVNLLGTILGDVLKEQGGDALFEQVETVRRLARRRREGDPQAGTDLSGLLAALPPTEMMALCRAFAAYFGGVNLAERVHRIRRRRSYLAQQDKPQPGTLIAVLEAMRARGVTAAQVQALLGDFAVTPVFTAHPTEATRRSLLTKEQRTARALVERTLHTLVPYEERAALERVRQEITTAWQTEELANQPTVAEEVEHVVFYLIEVIYRIVPAFYEGMSEAMQKVYSVTLPPFQQPLVRFGSWVGGDMDGNPNVGASTIRATLTRHRELILKRYLQELRETGEFLTQCRSRVHVDEALETRIAATRRLFLDEQIAKRYQDMPYRVFAWLLGRRLEETLADKVNGYPSVEAFADDLQAMLSSLQNNRGEHAGAFRVQRLLWRVQTFGFHLATLDIRQDALVHRRVAADLLGEPGFVDMTPAKRTEVLQKALKKVSLPPPTSTQDETIRVLDVLQTLHSCRERFGAAAVGPYIISMAQGADDVLTMLYLCRAAGFSQAQNQVPLDIAPLFETVPDLQNAQRSLTAMLADPTYLAHVAARGERQLVMLGYSDSNKESGIVASRWALQEAQVALVEVAEKAQVALTLFHGRGGTASRGGSKPRAAILAEPPGCVRGHLRLTEQGEIIHAKYGLRDIALRTLELMGGAVLEVSAGGVSVAPKSGWRDIAQCVAEQSRAAYRKLVYEDADFFAYFQQATPIDVIGRLAIGSRPAARRSQQGIGDLRAIPWVFSWTQNRQMLPGWYGVGAGLEAAIARFGLQAVRDVAQHWPFFSNLLADTEMILAKADMQIGAQYAALAADIGKRIWPQIMGECDRTVAALHAINGTRELLEREPVLQRAIRLRNPYVDPMSLIQIELLQRWRATDRQDKDIERVLLMTVKGIARGLQNTG